MYIEPTMRYYNGNGQCCGRARFLILCDTHKDTTLYAIVRKVALRQLGNWMMGKARIQGKTYSVSGSYGNDGLPMHFDKIPKGAKRVPDDLADKWNKGGGWNSAGSEGPAMRQWALENFKCKQ